MVYVNESNSPSTLQASEPSMLHPLDDMVQYLKLYTRERPEVVALACLGVGFILGWKLKPW